MNPPAKLSDLIQAIEFDSQEYNARFDRATGRIVVVEESILSALEEGEEDPSIDAPDWQKEEIEIARAIVADDGKRFIDAPDKFDFHEYRHMERFIRTLPDGEAAEQLGRAIKGRGAFRHFKDTLYRLAIQDQWYCYRDQALRKFVIEWAETNEVPFEDDIKES